jgi:hypothetical protein
VSEDSYSVLTYNKLKKKKKSIQRSLRTQQIKRLALKKKRKKKNQKKKKVDVFIPFFNTLSPYSIWLSA